jgi:thioester reductase-like protein
MCDVLTMVDERVAEDPDRLLYSFLDSRGSESARLTRANFLRRVTAIGTHLRLNHGLRSGERLLLAYPPGLEMICAFFGCAWAGVIPVPVAAPAAQGMDPALIKMAYVARDCDARAILTVRSTRDAALAHLAEMNSEGETAVYLAMHDWISTDDVSDEDADPRIRNHSSTLFLQYTSGSTSAPKGVMVTHGNVIANASQVVDHEGAVGVSWLPQHHDMGLIGYYINDALIGGTLYGFSPSTFIQRPALWLETITKYRATATSAPNFAFEYCLRPGRIPKARLENLDLSSLEFLMAAAEPIKPAIYERFLQTFRPYGLRSKAFVVAYGLAENTLAVSSYGRNIISVNRRALAKGQVRVTDQVSEVSAATRILSCGRPLGDTEALIVDPERRRHLQDGEVGEIWVTGSSKCAGYWGKPEATRETFQARLAGSQEGGPEFLRTGDLGFQRAGEIYVCGRHKDMIIVRGQNYYPQDLEAVVERESDAVRGGCTAAFEYDEADERGVAVVAEVVGAKSSPDGPAILAAVRRHLGLEVDRLVFVPPKSVPKTSSGKVMRFAARLMLAEGKFEVLHEVKASRALSDLGQTNDTGRPFEVFRARYKLTGDEDITLIEAGLDSLDLVLFLHELTERLVAKGAVELAGDIDHRLVQALSVREIFRLSERIDHDLHTVVAQIRRQLNSRRHISRAAERASMAADSALAFSPPTPRKPTPAEVPSSVLLTGATGFLGPFLLLSLLQQTDAKIHALVRARSTIEAHGRLRRLFERSISDPSALSAFDQRVVAVPGDLEKPKLGLDHSEWSRLAEEVDTIYHNGAMVNYVYTYERMRAANVLGTNEIIRLAFERRPKVLNYVSTTFIFGWATKDVLSEADTNSDMELLDFGYSQSKWVAEQLVLDARRKGLVTRVFRPALITPSLAGGGGAFDITLRILAFMIRHGITVNALSQVSFLPADVTANNIVAISNRPETANETFHVTRDVYANMSDVIRIVERLTGRQFEVFDLPDFVPEVIRRCTGDDPLFPLLDFLVGSIDNISSMEFKRYDNARYRWGRSTTPRARPDPSMDETVIGILNFMRTNGMTDLALTLQGARAPLEAVK